MINSTIESLNVLMDSGSMSSAQQPFVNQLIVRANTESDFAKQTLGHLLDSLNNEVIGFSKAGQTELAKQEKEKIKQYEYLRLYKD
jgi:hypothetical protein